MRLSHLMDGETWMNAKKALELGFCDEIAFQPAQEEETVENSFTFSRRAVTNCLMDKLRARMESLRAMSAASPNTADPTAEPVIDQPDTPEPDTPKPVNAEPPKPEAPRFVVSDNDPKLQLIRHQLLWEGFPHE